MGANLDHVSDSINLHNLFLYSRKIVEALMSSLNFCVRICCGKNPIFIKLNILEGSTSPTSSFKVQIFFTVALFIRGNFY